MDKNSCKKINISFIIEGEKIDINANIGDSILDIKHANEPILDALECACEGSLACSTCHVVVNKSHYNSSFQCGETEPSCEESDMLDLAMGVTNTSRLGCQVIMNEDLDGAVFTVPSENRNFSHKKAEDC